MYKFRRVVLLFNILIAYTAIYANALDVPFDVDDVINTVRTNPGYNRFRNNPFLIDTTIGYCPKAGGQGFSDEAFNGTDYLVVWEDDDGGSWNIFGTRVSAEGTVLDPAGIAISTSGGAQRFPSIASNGSDWFVAWRDGRYNGYYPDIFCARLSADGSVIDPVGIVVCTENDEQTAPAVSFDGLNYLIVWQDYRYGVNRVFGARVSQSGTVLDPQGFLVSTQGHAAEAPAISFGGQSYMVVWQDRYVGDENIGAARVSQSGVVLDPAGIMICDKQGDQMVPSIAYADTNWFVTWCDISGSHYQIYGSRVSQSGVVLDTLSIPISPDSGCNGYHEAAALGSSYFVVWMGRLHSIWGARVSLEGVLLDTICVEVSSAGYNEQIPSVIGGDSNYLVTWTEMRYDQGWDVYGGRVSEDCVPLDTGDILMTTTVSRQSFPAVAHGDATYLVAWEDFRDDPYAEIYVSRVAQNGIVLDPLPLPVSSATDAARPDAAYDGTNFLVVWSDENVYGDDIYGARVTQEGSLLDTTSIPVCTTSGVQVAPAIAFDGTNYFVVWNGWNLYGARVNPDGSVIDTSAIPISTAYETQANAGIAFGDTNYLVVWEDYRNDDYGDIRGARVTPGGIVLDPNSFVISDGPGAQIHPSIAFDGTNFLVVWTDWQPPYDQNIYGVLVDQSGTVLPSITPICTASNHQDRSATAFDGTRYVVLWQHEGQQSDICGAEVSIWGYVISYFTVAMFYGHQVAPALAHGSGHQLLMAYSGWVDSINTVQANTMRIWGIFSPPLGTEEDDRHGDRPVFDLRISPNPTCGDVYIRYTLAQSMKVSMSLFDVAGRLVGEIVDAYQNAGPYEYSLETENLSQGIYFIQLITPQKCTTEKIVIINQ